MKKKLTCSQQGSLANPTPLQENARHLVMSVIYGVKSSEFWGKRNQDSSWERTCQDSLPLSLEDSSEEYSMTWNPWGIVSGGLLMEPRISEQYTVEIESLSLPTPTASDGTMGAIMGKHDQFVTLKSGALRKINKNGNDGSVGLARTMMLVTPRASQDHKPIRPLAPSEANGTHGKTLVADIGNQLLPTPTVQDAKNNGSESQQKRNTKPLNAVAINLSLEETGNNGESPLRLGLNPEFVEAMMGFPIGWTDLNPSETP